MIAYRWRRFIQFTNFIIQKYDNKKYDLNTIPLKQLVKFYQEKMRRARERAAKAAAKEAAKDARRNQREKIIAEMASANAHIGDY